MKHDNELEWLIKTITEANEEYWERNTSSISDEEYDRRINRLAELDPEHPLLTSIGRSTLPCEIVHHEPMLSLSKAYTLDDVLKWAKKYARSPGELYECMPKYDGISVDVQKTTLSTRGDGYHGVDITDKKPLLRTIDGFKIITDIPYRGEIVCSWDMFKEKLSGLKLTGENSYQNPRNMISGIILTKDIKKIQKEFDRLDAYLTLVDYNAVKVCCTFKQLRDKWDSINWTLVTGTDYPIDGLVIKLADEKYAKSLGTTAHHPRGAIAFKFANKTKTTTLRDVELGVGLKNITFTAVFDPVKFEGVTVGRATLYNYQYLLDNDVRIGDTLTITRAGEVIPSIVGVTAGLDERKPIQCEHCPVCGYPTLIFSGSYETTSLICSNQNCNGKFTARWLSIAKLLSIRGIGPKLAEQLNPVLGIKYPHELLNLTVEQLQQLDKVAQGKSAIIVRQLIQKRTTLKDYEVLAMLFITGFGKTRCQELLKHCSLNELKHLNPANLQVLPDMGEVRANALFAALSDPETQRILEGLETFDIKVGAVEVNDFPEIVFTGKMSKPRQYFEALANERGYRPRPSVTNKDVVLVTGVMDRDSGKLVKARRLGCKIITEQEWLQSLQSSPSTSDKEA